MRKRWLILALIVLLGFMPLYATDYYVKNGGSDAASGLDDDNAWETIAKVNGESFSGDDIIYFNRGDEWREQLTVPDSGTSGHQITFGAYGEGAKPIINGADLVSTWTEHYGTPETWAAYTMAQDSSGDFNIRTPVAAATFAADGDQIQVKLVGNTANASVLSSVYIGEVASAGDAFDMEAGTITEITFSGTGGVTIGAGGNETSDWIAYAFDKDKNYFISFGTVDYHIAHLTAGVTSYFKAAASGDAGTANVTGYSNAANAYFLDEMKVRSAPANVWQATLNTEPTQVFFDGTRGTNQASIVACDAEFDWFWAANVLYVYSTTDPDTAYTSPGIEASIFWGININNDDYITVDGLDIKYSAGAGIRIYDTSSNVTVQNCTIQYNHTYGVQGDDTPDVQDACTISTNTCSYNGMSGIYAGRNCTNWLITTNTCNHNCALGDVGAYEAGIKLWDSTCATNVVEYNICHTNGVALGVGTGGVGIWVDEAGSNITVRYNECYSNNLHGIYIEKNSGVAVHYNLCYLNAEQGILLYGTNASPVDGNMVYNNVCYDNVYDGIKVMGDDGNASVTNNLIKNNISVDNDSQELSCLNGGENDGTKGSGNIYTHNCFGAEAADFIEWGATTPDTYDIWETAYGGTTNSVESDPLMTDPANDDFTLQSTSPCINAGTAVGLTEDYLGNPVGEHFVSPILRIVRRIILSPRNMPDIGAYEFWERR